ncbi:S-adenosylmethionine synthetase [Pyrobaculum aerophilum str. IM2]|uniref:S-adenosylmethionine synthase n=2 Tax=Pyrobaculum aerophilum TaxID=13773 RepID=METK_PYRAE|nr:methionine adenosyltransferase [Pyrobaculum aerophilum]Q8ZYP7.1 RecName: Full=S-adenosylmethionine synthase; Short=AdoMet synthase; AltName: Full=Methionine adenosyltransferase [Pyrobaculum aerophilum str. IM2]AAL62946.1 S-adenosylmethionine synthetase [Pyrobaculum aerophilum str. IM2]HII46082.1 methionine adenosyltransferase [Pyrobaculum aerophilum]
MIVVGKVDKTPVAKRLVEIVERKGQGHPDYIADGVAEWVSKYLSKYYLERFGVILHHNVDKTLVVGGQASPRFGGGEILQPIYILVSGRATYEVRTKEGVVKIPLGPIVMQAARDWIKNHFRYLDPDVHVVIDYRIGQGSADLVGIYDLGVRGIPLANDTSVGVGYAPLTPLEELVYKTERLLNSRDFKAKYPEVGEDVKVMGVRVGKEVKLTIATAMISRLVKDKSHYLSVKDDVKKAVEDLASKIAPEYSVEVTINAADKPEHGIFYLTVTGTSAEHGDDGMTGRGNRANGLITPMRSMSLEAAAGKNPVSHVGKIYNVVAQKIADRIYKEVKDVIEVYVEIVSQIGKPINEPKILNIEIIKDGELTGEVKNEVEAIAKEELGRITQVTDLILRGEVSLY